MKIWNLIFTEGRKQANLELYRTLAKGNQVSGLTISLIGRLILCNTCSMTLAHVMYAYII